MIRRTFNKLLTIFPSISIFPWSKPKEFKLELLTQRDYKLLENMLRSRFTCLNRTGSAKYIMVSNIDFQHIKCKRMDYLWRIVKHIEDNIKNSNRNRSIDSISVLPQTDGAYLMIKYHVITRPLFGEV